MLLKNLCTRFLWLRKEGELLCGDSRESSQIIGFGDLSFARIQPMDAGSC